MTPQQQDSRNDSSHSEGIVLTASREFARDLLSWSWPIASIVGVVLVVYWLVSNKHGFLSIAVLLFAAILNWLYRIADLSLETAEPEYDDDSIPEGPKKQLADLKRKVTYQLEDLDEAVSFWRPRAYAGHISIALIGAIITIIAGVHGDTPRFLSDQLPPIFLAKNNWILILSGIITIVSSWQAFYHHRDRWVSYDSAAKRLGSLLTEIDFYADASSVESTEVKRLLDEYNGIQSALDRAELAAMSKDDKKQ